MPMSCRQEIREVFPERSPEPLTWTLHHRKHFVQLNPDFAATKAFRPDVLREGARVFRYGEGVKLRPDLPLEERQAGAISRVTRLGRNSTTSRQWCVFVMSK